MFGAAVPIKQIFEEATVVHENEGEFQDDVRQFLIESNEGLAALDVDLVKLERSPDDSKLISSVFRSVHTIKGTCGFFGFGRLGAVAHVAENLLSQVRAGERRMTPGVTSLVLEAVDTIKALLRNIETTGSEGEQDYSAVITRLERAHGFVEEPAAGTTVAAFAVAAAAPAVDQEVIEVRASDSTIRVEVRVLDGLMNLVGELVLARNQLLQEAGRLNPELYKNVQRLNLITSELQAGVMKTRMQPVGAVWNKLPRVVRDLATQCGKRIRMEMVGAETALDKAVLEAIKDPLTHIVRNACDHGIELPGVRAAKHKDREGLLRLSAQYEGGAVHLEIADDGVGIDPRTMKAKALERGLITEEYALQMSDQAARELIFAPGFSTAAQVTKISGRGVGMDVVKTNIEKIGGSVEIEPGEACGTIVRIRIPLTLAIIPGLIVSLEGAAPALFRPFRQRFVLPQATLLALVRLEGAKVKERIRTLYGTPIFEYRGRLLPLVYLRNVLGMGASSVPCDAVSVVVLHAAGRELALVVDRIHDTQEIVVKPLARQFQRLTCYAGATIMSDGLPALILDVAGLARLAGIERPNARTAREAEPRGTEKQLQRLLLFAAGRWERIAVPLSLVVRLEEVPSQRMERAGARHAMQYRGEILPLVRLTSVLAPGSAQGAFAEVMQVIVLMDGARRVGVIVDRIVDIVEDAVTVHCGSSAPGLLGSAVVAGKIADLLDPDAVTGSMGDDWLGVRAEIGRGVNALLEVA